MATTPDEHEVGIDDLLVEMLRRRDVPCPVCRYNLRNLTSSVCPECGHRLTLRVGSVDPPFGALLLLLTPMLMTAGVALFFGVARIFVAPPVVPLWGFQLIWVSGFLEALAVLVINRKQATFLRRSKLVRVLLTGFVWAVNVAIFVVAIVYGL
ncbi:MAG: hypothetical protein IH986_04375 [Planctomycetes bacterium]|nr:hypothetical protein [Planctomycetota bacterium]